MAVIIFLSWIAVKKSVKPLKIIENSILRLKRLELSRPEELKKYLNRGSEIGHIATAMDSLYENFRGIVDSLKQCMGYLGETFGVMNEESQNLMEYVVDNAATTQELAASIGTTNSAIDGVRKEIGRITDMVIKVEGFSDIIAFLELDVSKQFQEFVGIVGEYSIAIDMFRHIINEIRETSDVLKVNRDNTMVIQTIIEKFVE